MKQSDAAKKGGHCPLCGGETSIDHKRRGFVRHLIKVYLPNGEQCTWGRGERDSLGVAA